MRFGWFVVLATAIVVALTACSADADVETPSPTAPPTASPTPSPAPDNEPYPEGAVGYAISWPQCGAPFPEPPYDFGIVGITDGRATTRNPCFEDEYRWAERARYHPSIYMNTNYVHDVAVSLVREPGCAARPLCVAENYGWFVAEDAWKYALKSRAVAPVWWLDVQIVSEWSDDPAVNAWAIEGAALFLRSKGIRVGISSTAYQWETIAGDHQHKLPIWDASAWDRSEAAEFCDEGKDFGGGPTELIAWVDVYETVRSCGGPLE